MEGFWPPLACGEDRRDQIAGLLGEVRSSRSGDSLGAGFRQPRRRGESRTRSRAPATLVDAIFHATADVGSIPTASTFAKNSNCPPHLRGALRLRRGRRCSWADRRRLSWRNEICVSQPVAEDPAARDQALNELGRRDPRQLTEVAVEVGLIVVASRGGDLGDPRWIALKPLSHARKPKLASAPPSAVIDPSRSIISVTAGRGGSSQLENPGWRRWNPYRGRYSNGRSRGSGARTARVLEPNSESERWIRAVAATRLQSRTATRRRSPPQSAAAAEAERGDRRGFSSPRAGAGDPVADR